MPRYPNPCCCGGGGGGGGVDPIETDCCENATPRDLVLSVLVSVCDDVPVDDYPGSYNDAMSRWEFDTGGGMIFSLHCSGDVWGLIDITNTTACFGFSGAAEDVVCSPLSLSFVDANWEFLVTAA